MPGDHFRDRGASGDLIFRVSDRFYIASVGWQKTKQRALSSSESHKLTLADRFFDAAPPPLPLPLPPPPPPPPRFRFSPPPPRGGDDDGLALPPTWAPAPLDRPSENKRKRGKGVIIRGGRSGSTRGESDKYPRPKTPSATTEKATQEQQQQQQQQQRSRSSRNNNNNNSCGHHPRQTDTCG